MAITHTNQYNAPAPNTAVVHNIATVSIFFKNLERGTGWI